MEIRGVIGRTTLKVSRGLIAETRLSGQDSTPEKTDLFLLKCNNINT